jgi:hypothetical protein
VRQEVTWPGWPRRRVSARTAPASSTPNVGKDDPAVPAWPIGNYCGTCSWTDRTRDLEALVRQANAMAGRRSFKDVVNAFRAMRTLG